MTVTMPLVHLFGLSAFLTLLAVGSLESYPVLCPCCSILAYHPVHMSVEHHELNWIETSPLTSATSLYTWLPGRKYPHWLSHNQLSIVVIRDGIHINIWSQWQIAIVSFCICYCSIDQPAGIMCWCYADIKPMLAPCEESSFSKGFIFTNMVDI